MTSDDDTQGKKNLNPLEGLELDDDLAHATSEDLEDIDDIEEIIEASPLGSELDNEVFSGDDDDDFAAELSAVSEGGMDTDEMPAYDTDDDEYVAKSGGMKKVLAPALVIVIAAGVAGYIMMNPAVLSGVMGGGSSNDGGVNVPAQQTVLEVVPVSSEDEELALAQANKKAKRDAAEAKKKQAAVLADVPPQPSVNMNADAELAASEEVMSPDEAIAEILDAGEDMQAEMSGDSKPALLAGANADMLSAPVDDVTAVEPPAFENDLPAEVSVDMPSMEKVDTIEVTEVKMPRAPTDVAPAKAEVKVAAAEKTKAPTENDIFESDFKEASGASVATPEKKPTSAKADGDNSFYDSEVRVPGSQIAGPRKLDPRVEPATKFVVATQDHKASDQESMVIAANRALKLRRYDAARDMFEGLYAKNARDKRILMGLAIAQQNTGRVESAIKTYEELLEIDPDNANAMVNMLGLLREQYPSVALRRLMDLQSRFPNNSGIAAQIGVTQADLGQYQEAVRYLSQAASLDPQNPQHLFNLAIVTDRQGHTTEAIGYYEQALEVDTVYGGGQTLPRETIYDRLAKLRMR